jgi:hypothetical protein
MSSEPGGSASVPGRTAHQDNSAPVGGESSRGLPSDVNDSHKDTDKISKLGKQASNWAHTEFTKPPRSAVQGPWAPIRRRPRATLEVVYYTVWGGKHDSIETPESFTNRDISPFQRRTRFVEVRTPSIPCARSATPPSLPPSPPRSSKKAFREHVPETKPGGSRFPITFLVLVDTILDRNNRPAPNRFSSAQPANRNKT